MIKAPKIIKRDFCGRARPNQELDSALPMSSEDKMAASADTL